MWGGEEVREEGKGEREDRGVEWVEQRAADEVMGGEWGSEVCSCDLG